MIISQYNRVRCHYCVVPRLIGTLNVMRVPSPSLVHIFRTPPTIRQRPFIVSKPKPLASRLFGIYQPFIKPDPVILNGE